MKKNSSKSVADSTAETSLSVETNRPEDESLTSESFLERVYGRQSKWLVSALLVFGCLIIYFQVSGFQFINFDDPAYVYNNQSVKTGLSWENVKWAFSVFHAANWHPLTWISHQIDSSLFQLNAGNHHLVNVFFHTLNAVLLFFTIRSLTGSTWKSGIVAAIFAFHPAHVESVAWVSERKDVLSTMFWLLTTWCYSCYAKGDNRSRNYGLMLLLFVLGLMAKPMLVTLPFTLLLLDFWPLKRIDGLNWSRIGTLVLEKLPMFVLAGASSVMTFYAQRSGGAVMALENLPFGSRVINAAVSYVKYIGMLFYPLDLGGWYPYADAGFPIWQIAGAFLVLAAITVYALWSAMDKRYLIVGWLWFLGTMVPVIGLVQVGRQSHADRYTYIPFIGLSIAVVWLIGHWVEKQKVNKDLISAVTAGILLVMCALCYKQVSYWKNNETFYTRTLAVTTKNYLFEQNYCQYLLEAERLDDAEFHCKNSIVNSNPPYANAYLSMGLVQMKKNNYEAALENFEIASRLRPSDLPAFSNYISALMALERYDAAEEKINLMRQADLDENLKKPYLLQLYSRLSYLYGQKGSAEKAIENARKAIEIGPAGADLYANLGLLLYKSGKLDDALVEMNRSLEMHPSQADLQTAVGKIYLDQGKKDEARSAFEKAKAIDPNLKAATEHLDKMNSPK